MENDNVQKKYKFKGRYTLERKYISKRKNTLPKIWSNILILISRQEIWNNMNEIDKEKRTEMWSTVGEYIVCRGRNVILKNKLCDEFFFGTYELSDKILINLCDRIKNRYGALIVIKNSQDNDSFVKELEGKNAKTICDLGNIEKVAVIYDDCNGNIILNLTEL